MKTIVSVVILLCSFVVGYSQQPAVVPLRGDTIKISKVGGYAELVLQNRTKDTIGVLTNYGNGKTKFIKSKVNGSTLIVGLDTLTLPAGMSIDTFLYKRPPIYGTGTITDPIDTKVMVIWKVDSLRTKPADSTWVYRLVTDKDVYDFVYDPTDSTSADDSVMVVRNGAARFKRKVETYINFKWFGSLPGNLWDNRNALLRAFNYFKNNSRSGTLYIPAGKYAIHSTVSFNFGTGITVNMIGDASGGRGSGSTFAWHGPSGQAMFELMSVYHARFENLEMRGRNFGTGSAARNAIHFKWVSGGLSSLINIEKCTFGEFGGDSSAIINFNGTGGLGIINNQVDESTIKDCALFGIGYNQPDSLKLWHCVLLGGNNTKNFILIHNQMVGATKSIVKALGGGVGTIYSERNMLSTSRIHFDLVHPTSLVSMLDYSESVGQILEVGGGGAASFDATLIGYQDHSANHDGANPEYPIPNPNIIEGEGVLQIIGGLFNYGPRVPKIEWATDGGLSSVYVNGAKFTSIRSNGQSPFYSSGNNILTGNRETDPGQNIVHRVTAINIVGLDSNMHNPIRWESRSTEPVNIRGFANITAWPGRPTAAMPIDDWKAGDMSIDITGRDARTKQPFFVCVRSGTFKTISVTGEATTGSAVVKSISDISQIKAGDIIVFSAGFNGQYPYTVNSVAGDSIMLTYAASGSGTITITNSVPLFAAGHRAYGPTGAEPTLTHEDFGFTYTDTTLNITKTWYGDEWKVTGESLWEINTDLAIGGIITPNNIQVGDTNKTEELLIKIENTEGSAYIGIGAGITQQPGHVVFSRDSSFTVSNWDMRLTDPGVLELKEYVVTPAVRAILLGVGAVPIVGWQNTPEIEEYSGVGVMGYGEGRGIQDWNYYFGGVNSILRMRPPTSSVGFLNIRSDTTVGIFTETPRNMLSVNGKAGYMYNPTMTAADSLVWANNKYVDSVNARKQNTLTLTTDGTNGVATLSGDTLNVPNYAAGAGSGDASTNTSTSVDDELPLFSSTSGKLFKRATGTGFVKVTSGVVSYQAAIDTTDIANFYLKIRALMPWIYTGANHIYFLNKVGILSGAGTPSYPLHVSAIPTGGALFGLFPASYTDGDIMAYINSGVHTGYAYQVYATGNATGDLNHIFANTNNTVGTSNSVLHVSTGGTSAGDPYLRMQVLTGGDYSIGVDNSANDVLRLTNAATPSGGGTGINITTYGKVDVTDSLTVSTLTAGGIVKATVTTGNLVIGTIDTTDIATFAAKVRSLFSVGSGMTYNADAGIFTATGGGSGTVTDFSAGDLSPLFTTSEATTTTTPALTFGLSNAAAYTLFGRASGTGAPSYLASIDSNWVTGFHSEAYFNTKYSLLGHAHAAILKNTDESAINIYAGMKGDTAMIKQMQGNLAASVSETDSLVTVSVLQQSFTLTAWHGTWATVNDANTYYFSATQTSAIPVIAAPGTRQSSVGPYDCTLVGYAINTINTGTPSQESATVVIRKNNTTDITLSSAVTVSATANQSRSFEGTITPVDFDAGDDWEVKLTTPTYTTNPGTLQVTVTLWFNRR